MINQLNDQTVLFHTIQFSMGTHFEYQIVLFDPKIGPFSGATNPGQSRPVNDAQSLIINEATPLDSLMSIQNTHWEGLLLYRDRIVVFYSPTPLSRFSFCTHLNVVKYSPPNQIIYKFFS